MRKRQKKKLLRGTRRQRRKAAKQRLAAMAYYMSQYRTPPVYMDVRLPDDWIAVLLGMNP